MHPKLDPTSSFLDLPTWVGVYGVRKGLPHCALLAKETKIMDNYSMCYEVKVVKNSHVS